MNSAAVRPYSRPALAALALLSLLAALAFAAPASQAAPVTKDAVLLQTEETPWNDEFNPQAMEAAFGSNWEEQKFDQVQTGEGSGGLFAPHVRLIWIEGSDESTEAAIEFIEANEAALEAFVARGGSLFVNSATNQELTVEFEGRQIGQVNPEDFTPSATAVDPSHPIFNGPATPNATSWTGNSFAHGRVMGPSLTPLIIGTANDGPVSNGLSLAEYSTGPGHVMLGAMTAVQFQEPEEAAKSLRINILSYLFSLTKAPVTPPPPTTPDTSDKTKPKVKVSGIPKHCVDGGFGFSVKVTDAGGVGSVRVKLSGKILRKANGKGATSKVVKVHVPAGKLDHSGHYQLNFIAADLAGNVTRKASGFRVCG
jgi:hypothetical protein